MQSSRSRIVRDLAGKGSNLWSKTKEGWPWMIMMLAVWIYLLTASQVINERVRYGNSPWDSDFATFRQAGYLLGHGHPDQVYRYVYPSAEARASLPPIWDIYVQNLGGWGSYHYGQLPWYALLMVPFGFLPLRAGYIYYSLIMLASMLVAGGLLVRYTRYGWLWGSLLLLLPIIAPVVSGYPWEQQLRFQWSFLQTTGIANKGGATVAAFWLGQPTPLILAFLTGGLVAAARNRMAIAGLMALLVVMKPAVFFALLLFLVVTSHWGRLLKWMALWAIVFNITFALVPGLGYPASFLDIAGGTMPSIIPFLLQSHNWVWLYGGLVSALALRFWGKQLSPEGV